MTLPDVPYTEPNYVFHQEHQWYPGTVHTIEEAPSTREGWADQFKWVIHLDGELADDGSQLETWAYCTQVLSPKSKLMKWASGLLGKDNVPRPINVAIFVGTRLEVMFETYTGQDRDGMPVEKERVAIMRALQGAPAQQTATPIQEAREAMAPDEMPF